jgi:hypothetical protein
MQAVADNMADGSDDFEKLCSVVSTSFGICASTVPSALPSQTDDPNKKG